MPKFENLTQRMYEQGVQQKFFKQISEGEFPLYNVRFKFAHGSMQRTPESEALIDQLWQRHLNQGFKAWPNDTKSTRYRFVDAKVVDGKLVVTIDFCVSYKDYVATAQPEFIENFSHEFLSETISSASIIETKNRAGQPHIMITIRNKKQDYKPGGFLPGVGGWPQADKHETLIESMYREITEESGIKKNELRDLTCVGVVRDQVAQLYSLNFVARTDAVVEELRMRRHDDENTVQFIPVDKISIQKMLLAYSHADAPVGVSLLLTYGKQKFGTAWYREMGYALAWRSEGYDSKKVRNSLEVRDVARLARQLNNTSD